MKTEINLNITLTQIYWAAFAVGSGLLCGAAAVIVFASAVRDISRFIGLAS